MVANGRSTREPKLSVGPHRHHERDELQEDHEVSKAAKPKELSVQEEAVRARLQAILGVDVRQLVPRQGTLAL
ncbi:hypothetical protein Acsp06_65460 [Actinomycetospora sp. NBRC 106375]|nr:hypothetical protein Acsp06_65460 [Actinomycetospora sp. NBRC 106375]